MFFWTAFMMGIVGSLHCVGMCGPIALALPFQGTNRWAAAGNVLLYNLGRVLTYSLLGLLIGLIGEGISIAGVQAQLSIGLGVFLLLAALFSVNLEAKIIKLPFVGRLNGWVKRKLAHRLANRNRSTLFSIGLLNGLLPCGLVYIAIAGALTSGDLVSGMLYMALFGIGTIPLMLSTAMAGQFVGLGVRRRLRQLIPVFLAAFALLFIARGFQFQIPADFRFWEGLQDMPMCH